MFGRILDNETTGAEVEADLQWIGKRAADGSKEVVWDIVKGVASEGVRGYLRAHGFPL
jgi:hypothetical protein